MKKATHVKVIKAPKAAKPAKADADLEKGQLYRIKNGHVEIVEVGKLLVHYRTLPRLDPRDPKKMGSRGDVAAFLKKNGAKLVTR